MIQRKENATERDTHYGHSIVVLFLRKEYSEGVCTVSVPKCNTLFCEHLDIIIQSGAQKKGRKEHNRPSNDNTVNIIKQIKSTAPPAIVEHDDLDLATDSPQSLTCPLCLSMLKQPVELQCNNLVCVDCCCNWIEPRGELESPCCYDHQLGKDTVRQPSPVIIDLMSQLKLQCDSCKNTTTVEQYNNHRKSLYFADYTLTHLK